MSIISRISTSDSILSSVLKELSNNDSYKEELKIIEVQKGTKLVEDDIIRYKDIYGRVQ